MPYYTVCPECKSTLDPGERCFCRKPEQRIANILKQQNPLHDLMTKEKSPTASMTRYIFAVDPGNTQSAYTLIEVETLRPVATQIVPNGELLQLIAGYPDKDTTAFVIEMVASYGMAVGAEVFETVFWIGRFYAAAEQFHARERIYRMDVKMHLCHNSRAKDANIRQALIDRFGGVGTKKAPGWFYGFKADMWAAYAVGATHADSLNAERTPRNVG